VIATCTRCRELYAPAAPTAETQELTVGFDVCPRCLTIAELLTAADVLNAEVAKYLSREKAWHPGARFNVEPLLERSQRAVERARATL
jgi:hypothetical protein